MEYAAALAGYQRALRAAPLSAATRAKYVSRVRGYLLWLATTAALETDGTAGGDPLQEAAARDGAVRDWRVWAKTVGRLRPATINNTLAAIDDFYTRRGLGPATARRGALPRRAPEALSQREVVRYLRAVEHCGNARYTVVALLPFYSWSTSRIANTTSSRWPTASSGPDPTSCLPKSRPTWLQRCYPSRTGESRHRTREPLSVREFPTFRNRTCRSILPLSRW